MADKYRTDVMNFKNLIKGKVFYVYDTETTGLKVSNADIIEFSALKVDGDTMNVLEVFDTFINPGYALPPEIIEFNSKNDTGITDEVLSMAPSAKAAAEMIDSFMGDSPIVVGHNSIRFDTEFVNKLFINNLNKEFSPMFQLDTLLLSKEKVTGSHKLSDLFMQTGTEDAVGFHTSIADTNATLEVLKWLLPMYDRPEQPSGKLNINRIQRWKKSETLDRIYINNSQGISIFYDVANRRWETGVFDESEAIAAVYLYAGVSDDEELIRKYN